MFALKVWDQKSQPLKVVGSYVWCHREVRIVHPKVSTVKMQIKSRKRILQQTDIGVRQSRQTYLNWAKFNVSPLLHSIMLEIGFLKLSASTIILSNLSKTSICPGRMVHYRNAWNGMREYRKTDRTDNKVAMVWHYRNQTPRLAWKLISEAIAWGYTTISLFWCS